MEKAIQQGCRYVVRESRNEWGVTYGIQAVSTTDGRLLQQIDDICPDREAVEALSVEMDRCHVDILHMINVIEDFLDARYG